MRRDCEPAALCIRAIRKRQMYRVGVQIETSLAKRISRRMRGLNEFLPWYRIRVSLRLGVQMDIRTGETVGMFVVQDMTDVAMSADVDVMLEAGSDRRDGFMSQRAGIRIVDR